MDEKRRIIYIQEVAFNTGAEEWFIEKLIEQGILEIHVQQEENFFEPTEIELIRRAARLNHHLGVNVEGIDIILQMRQRLENLQRQIENLQSQIGFYHKKDQNSGFIEINPEND